MAGHPPQGYCKLSGASVCHLQIMLSGPPSPILQEPCQPALSFLVTGDSGLLAEDEYPVVWVLPPTVPLSAISPEAWPPTPPESRHTATSDPRCSSQQAGFQGSRYIRASFPSPAAGSTVPAWAYSWPLIILSISLVSTIHFSLMSTREENEGLFLRMTRKANFTVATWLWSDHIFTPELNG